LYGGGPRNTILIGYYNSHEGIEMSQTATFCKLSMASPTFIPLIFLKLIDKTKKIMDFYPST
jgi:hypothetical protein